MPIRRSHQLIARYPGRCLQGKRECSRGGKVAPGEAVYWYGPMVVVHVECHPAWIRKIREDDEQQTLPGTEE